MDSLPTDILLYTFQYLPYNDILHLILLNHHYKELIRDDSKSEGMWQRLVERDFKNLRRELNHGWMD